MFASSRIQEGSRVPGDKELGVQRTIVITNNFIIVELIFSRGVGVPSTIPQCKPGGLVNTPQITIFKFQGLISFLRHGIPFGRCLSVSFTQY